VGGRWVTSKANLQVRISMCTGIEIHVNNCRKCDMCMQYVVRTEFFNMLLSGWSSFL
jgi:hypothetical protein